MFNEWGNTFNMIVGLFSFCLRRQLRVRDVTFTFQPPVCSLSRWLHNIHVLKLRHCSWKNGTHIHHELEDCVTDFANSLNCFTGNCPIMSEKQIRLRDGGVMCSWSLCLESWSGGSGCDWLWISMTRGEIALVLVSCWQGSFISDRDTGLISSKCLSV